MQRTLYAILVTGSLLLSPLAYASKDLATKNGCMACHGVETKVMGPAFRDIAKKYKPTDEARLIERVKRGTAATGGQVWKEINGGVVPMPANTQVKDADIKQMVRWILAGAIVKP